MTLALSVPVRAGQEGRGFAARVAPGFSLFEVVVVLVVAMTLLSITVVTFSHYNGRTSAQRAAQVFARDLTLARSMAVRGRETVTIKFYENAMWYAVTTASGRELARRTFGTTGEVALSAVDLALTGDSLQFSNGGVGNLSGATVGTATFTAGNSSYRVTFNSLGASKVGAT